MKYGLGAEPGSALAQPIAAQALGLQWVGLRAHQLCDGLEPIGLRSHQKCPSPAQALPSGTLVIDLIVMRKGLRVDEKTVEGMMGSYQQGSKHCLLVIH